LRLPNAAAVAAENAGKLAADLGRLLRRHAAMGVELDGLRRHCSVLLGGRSSSGTELRLARESLILGHFNEFTTKTNRHLNDIESKADEYFV
jgi:hypothetical protein